MTAKLNAYILEDLPIGGKNNDLPTKFFVLEGKCEKCGVGDHTLIQYEFVRNPKAPKQSIIKVKCIVCEFKKIYFTKDIHIIRDNTEYLKKDLQLPKLPVKRKKNQT